MERRAVLPWDEGLSSMKAREDAGSLRWGSATPLQVVHLPAESPTTALPGHGDGQCAEAVGAAAHGSLRHTAVASPMREAQRTAAVQAIPHQILVVWSRRALVWAGVSMGAARPRALQAGLMLRW